MPRRILIGFGVDVDAVAGWLGSYGGEDSPSDISRGVYAGEVGSLRLLKLFDKYKIKTTWFIPCHSLETFPEQMAAVRDAGHEIGLHGYSHENPVSLTLEQQRDILDHTYNLLTKFNNGIPPKGSVAPWWETSKEGSTLLLDKGIEYDHSNMARDSQAFYLRDQDLWTKIDYKAKAETWMKPLVRGKATGLVEIPANWYLDDLPPMMFIKSSPNSHGWVNTRDVEQLWKDMFTYLYREEENFIFPITIHPDVSGRPHVLLMLRFSPLYSTSYVDLSLTFYYLPTDLPSCRHIRTPVSTPQERFIEWVNTHADVRWVPMIDMANEFRARVAPPPGAVMPRGFAGPAPLKAKL